MPAPEEAEAVGRHAVTDGAEARRVYAMAIMIIGSVVISFGGLLIRSMEQADVWHIVLYRAMSLMGAITIFLLFQYRGRMVSQVLKIGRPGIAAGLCLAAASITFLHSMTTTTVANTLFMLGSIPFFTAIMAYFFLKEKLQRETVITMIVAGGGIAVMLGDGIGGGSTFGNVMALITAVSFAGYAVLVRYNRAVDMLPTLLVSTPILITIGVIMKFDALSIPVWDMARCFLLGAGMSGVANFFFVIASRHLVAAEVTLFMLLEFALGPIWVWLFVGEIPTSLTALGGILVMSAVALRAVIQLRRARRMKRKPVPIGVP